MSGGTMTEEPTGAPTIGDATTFVSDDLLSGRGGNADARTTAAALQRPEPRSERPPEAAPTTDPPARPESQTVGSHSVVSGEVFKQLDVPDRVNVPETERNPLRVALRHTLIRQFSRSLSICDRIFGDRTRSGFGVLMYHRCCPGGGGSDAPTLNVPPEALHAQLSGLQRHGFQFRSLPDVLDACDAGKAISRKTVVVTFDDGFACLADHALPVLRDLNVPASVFVCTGMIDRPGPMPFDPWGRRMEGRIDESAYRSLNSDEVRRMLDTGLIDIGAHTHTHDDFRGRPEHLQADLDLCTDVLAGDFNIVNPTFAFPFGTPSLGFADDALAAAARDAGMRCALTTENRIVQVTDDPYAWGRLNAFEWDTAATLRARLHGWYSWLPRMWASVRRRRMTVAANA